MNMPAVGSHCAHHVPFATGATVTTPVWAVPIEGKLYVGTTQSTGNGANPMSSCSSTSWPSSSSITGVVRSIPR